MKKIIYFLVLSHLIFMGIFGHDDAQSTCGPQQEQPSLVGTIEDLNMASLPRFDNQR